MQLTHQPMAIDARPRGAVPLWLLLAMAGVALGSVALVAALAGSGVELAGSHFALRKLSIL